MFILNLIVILKSLLDPKITIKAENFKYYDTIVHVCTSPSSGGLGGGTEVNR